MAKEFNWTPLRQSRMEEALKNMGQVMAEAAVEYGQYFLMPIITTDTEIVFNGRLKPNDYNEYRRLVNLIKGVKKEDFKTGNLSGVTKFDDKFAKMVERQYLSKRKKEVKEYEEEIKKYKARASKAKTQEERAMYREIAKNYQQNLNRIKKYQVFTPSTARDAEQFKLRVLGRQGATSQAYQRLKAERYRQNYLKALRNGAGISASEQAYRKIAQMPIDAFLNMMEENTNLQSAFIYEISDIDYFTSQLDYYVDEYTHA